MNFHNNNQGYNLAAEGFMSKVYSWMSAGLGLTALVAYLFSPYNNVALYNMTVSSGMTGLLMFVQIGIGMFFWMSWERLSYGTLATLYIIYSSLWGVVLTPVVFQFTAASLFTTFAITAGMFLTMAVYGWVTKSDLSTLRSILIMGLFGLIIANLVNIFFHSPGFDLAISCVGVGVFAMFVAYDMQRLKEISQRLIASPEDTAKVSLIGAMMLYLDIINLFLYLLKIFGKRRR